MATLALCIGANAAKFSLVDSVLLRTVPYPEPERLVEVAVVASDSGAEMKSFGHEGRTWEELRSRLRLTRLAALSGLVTTANFAYGSNVGTAQLQRVSAGFFAVLGVEPWRGGSSASAPLLGPRSPGRFPWPRARAFEPPGLGLTLGIALSLAASRLMRRHLWEVAAAVPALRVAGLDPARKLREE